MRNATATARKSAPRAKSAPTLDDAIRSARATVATAEAAAGIPHDAPAFDPADAVIRPAIRKWRALAADLPAAKVAAKLVDEERKARQAAATAMGHGSTVTVDGVTYCAALKTTSRVDHAAQWAAALDAAPPAFRAVMESIAASGRYVSPSVNAEIVTLAGGAPTGN